MKTLKTMTRNEIKKGQTVRGVTKATKPLRHIKPITAMPKKTTETYPGTSRIPSGHPIWAVRLHNQKCDQSSNITLPFIPFPGLRIRVPFRKMDYAKIKEVYWREDKAYFEVWLAD